VMLRIKQSSGIFFSRNFHPPLVVLLDLVNRCV